MFIVFFAVISVALVGSFYWTEKGHVIIGNLGLIINGILLIPVIFIGVVFLIDIAAEKNIDEKILIYEQENENIEEQLIAFVKNYTEYEVTDIEENVLFFISSKNDLKTDSFIRLKVNTYIENEGKIQTLAEKKMNLPVKKWWLYFGS